MQIATRIAAFLILALGLFTTVKPDKAFLAQTEAKFVYVAPVEGIIDL